MLFNVQSPSAIALLRSGRPPALRRGGGGAVRRPADPYRRRRRRAAASRPWHKVESLFTVVVRFTARKQK